MSARHVSVALCSALLLLVACDDPVPFAPTSRDAGPPPVCEGASEGIVCAGDVAWSCDARGVPRMPDDCAARGERCVTGTGCRPCLPNEVRCDGETIEVCDAAGSGWTRGATCDPSTGQRCSADGCVDLCARAAEDRSYLGCEYWPVVTRNAPLPREFTFAVAIANPQLVPAVIVVDRAGTEIARRTVAPGALEIVALPWIESLRAPLGIASVREADGAYHLVSDVPVVVTQWNPLEFRLEHDCEDEEGVAGDRQCHSFTNDASLLLPAHVLTGNYVAVSRPTFFLGRAGTYSTSPGFVTIVGAAEGEVSVEIEASARIAPSLDGTFAAMAPGERRTITLARGEVIQLASEGAETCPGVERVETSALDPGVRYCDPGAEYDLTGTIVRADGPVAVIAGHDCTFVPFDRWACDHLEEQLFPVESLGRSAFVAPTSPLRDEPNLLRVVSAADANTITFTPAIHAPITLGRGEHAELELRDGVRVEGTGALLATLFLVGQDYAGLGTSGRGGSGDPGMALAIPDAQFRSSYTVLAPETYRQSWLDMIAPTGARVELDRTIVTGWREIEGTGWSHASMQIQPGVHRASAERPFGLQVYGFGAYTSYVVSGGLDLRPITPPI
ncbi:IgGFc-binding protein [Sandaracinus amylolyticus]|uniref:IgGFc-binding protein n=1 Tax=Sandaracinus amylolyticus TaxID=927083 RepID=UPI0012ED2E08|nr:IgGFc-binding protein [Sandaracinus amylolyticus]